MMILWEKVSIEGEIRNGLKVGQVSQSDTLPIIRRISVSLIKLSPHLLALQNFSIFKTTKSNHLKAAMNCNQIYCKSVVNK